MGGKASPAWRVGGRFARAGLAEGRRRGVGGVSGRLPFRAAEGAALRVSPDGGVASSCSARLCFLHRIASSWSPPCLLRAEDSPARWLHDPSQVRRAHPQAPGPAVAVAHADAAQHRQEERRRLSVTATTSDKARSNAGLVVSTAKAHEFLAKNRAR